MGAPPTALINALRGGTVFRHLFFRMTHPQGTVLAWDGIGEIEFAGETYVGVGSFGEIGGVSNSGDIQNHLLEITLNAVPYDVLRTTDPNIAGEAAKLSAVWLSEAGEAVASRTLFLGKGSFMRLKTEEETATLRVFLRGPAVDWTTVPRSYYTPADQQRLFAADTGFSQVAGLENAVIAGWQSTTPGGSDPFPYTPATNTRRVLRSTDNVQFGHNLWGPFFEIDGTDYNVAGNVHNLIERTALHKVQFEDGGEALRSNGQQLLFDVDGFVVSSTGNFIVSSDNPANDANRLRAIGSSGVTANLQARSFGSGLSRLTAVNLTAGASPTLPDYARVLFDEFDPGEVRLVRIGVTGPTDTWQLINARTNVAYALSGTSGYEVIAVCNALTDPTKNPNNITMNFRLIGFAEPIKTNAAGHLIRPSSGADIRQVGATSAQSRLRVWA